MSECKSFSAKVNNNSKILILGSMPGEKSLMETQYYAHPYNRFWKIMGILCKEDNMVAFSYEDRINVLLRCGFALWDVIGKCRRDGSLDSAIKDEMPNDIKGLLKKYPNIKIICLNGNKAFSSFKKYFPEILEDKKYSVHGLPSTSPANARYRMDDLLKCWGKVIISAPKF